MRGKKGKQKLLNQINKYKWMKQISTEGVQVLTWLGGEDDQFGIVQIARIWSYCQMVCTQSRNYPKKWDMPNSVGLWFVFLF